METKARINQWISGFAAVITAAVLLVAAASPVSAAAPQQVSPPPTAQESGRGGKALERLYKRQVDWAKEQAERIVKAGEVTQQVQERISQWKEAGQDVSAAQAALDRYTAAVGEAKSLNEQAGKALTQHLGFDAEGKVIDEKLAWDTVHTAGLALIDARYRLARAAFDLRTITGKQRAGA